MLLPCARGAAGDARTHSTHAWVSRVRTPIPAFAGSQLRQMLTPWVASLLAQNGAPSSMRLGVGGTSVSLFAAQPPSARRLGGGALALHRDYTVKQVPRNKHAFNIILLLEDVGEGDGPTFVFEGSREADVHKQAKLRELHTRGYKLRKLVGKRGDVFVFHAADWHGVEGILLPPRASPRATEMPPQTEMPRPSQQLRANLVLGAWHSCFDGFFVVEH